MSTRIARVKLYGINELNDKAKRKAINDTWISEEYNEMIYHEIRDEITNQLDEKDGDLRYDITGIDLVPDDIDFDVDHASVSFKARDCDIAFYKVLDYVTKIGGQKEKELVKKVTPYDNVIDYSSFEINDAGFYGVGANVVLDYADTAPASQEEKELDKIGDMLQYILEYAEASIKEKISQIIRATMDYYMQDEIIVQWLEDGDIEFTRDGRVWNYKLEN